MPKQVKPKRKPAAKNKAPGATKTDISKKAMLEALEKSLGVVTTAAKAAGVARSQHYRWYEDDAKYKAAVDEVAEVALDFAESKLHSQINSGDTTATIFYLKTKGKRRGYVERSEVENTINHTQPIIIDWTHGRTSPQE